MKNHDQNTPVEILFFCALAAFIMSHGWGYRGTVGHEAGAMVPGALLGLAVSLASGRMDWHRRAAVTGLFAAVGWAWGGSLSYMEHTFYVTSDSLIDVLYGYSILCFLGALWAGCGGAILGLALTEPRSELDRLARVFAVVCAVFLAVHLILISNRGLDEWNETLTVRYFHDGDWLAATLTLVVSGVYGFVRKNDRPAAALFFFAALAWWAGYGILTQLLDLRLAPLHRSEGWGGVLGILITLLIYLWRRNNHAALMLCRYGIVGGGIAFSIAVFLRHPAMAEWNEFANWPQLAGWRFSENSYGFLMGLIIALGVYRLLRGGLTPPKEDAERTPLDTFGVFVMLVALPWINFRRHFARFFQAAGDAAEAPVFLGLPIFWCILLVAAVITCAFLFLLFRYLRGDRELVPHSPFGKCVAVTLMLLWMCEVGHLFDGLPTSVGHMKGSLWGWVPAAIATLLIVRYAARSPRATVLVAAETTPSDRMWKPGIPFALACCAVPIVLLMITFANLSMQDEPLEGHARKRFGPEAYWRQTARMLGTWNAVGFASRLDGAPTRTQDVPVAQLMFGPYRNVKAILPSGEAVEQHRWSLKNQYTWLDWYDRVPDHPERARTPLEFQGQYVLIAWPPGDGNAGYLVLERAED